MKNYRAVYLIGVLLLFASRLWAAPGGLDPSFAGTGTVKQELEGVGLQPSHNLEAALIETIQPGQYTAQVRGKGQASGIGVVQVYFLQ